VTDEYAPKWRNGEEGSGFYHYDKKKEDHYAGGLIDVSDPNTAVGDLPDAMKLNNF
jgi:hypothetical protein